MSFGSLIRSLRKQNNLTQAEPADRLGITDKAVSKWERDLSYPDIALFPQLADILGVSVNDLLLLDNGDGTQSRLSQIFRLSHDIRTPLHFILGCTDLAMKYRNDPEALNHYLECIRISGNYLLDAVNYLMRIASDNNRNNTGKPLIHIDEAWESLSSRSDQQTPRKYDFRGRKILVVDDMELNREIAAEILKPTGAFIEYAENGKQAVEKFRNTACDLILMDLQMPQMSGSEAAAAIRALNDPVLASVPIIAMSASIYEADRKAAEDAGMNGFIEQPVDVGKLYDTLWQYLGTG